MVTIQPMDDRVVIQVLEQEEKTAGGIVLPDTAKEKPQQGKVKSVGSGKLLNNGKRSTLSVKKGDTVIFGTYAGTDVSIDGGEYKILRESEILAKVEK